MEHTNSNSNSNSNTNFEDTIQNLKSKNNAQKNYIES